MIKRLESSRLKQIRMATLSLLAFSFPVAEAAQLISGLEATPDLLTKQGGGDLLPGDNIERWSERQKFYLNENPSAGDGPVYLADGASGFNATLFNGQPYLDFTGGATGGMLSLEVNLMSGPDPVTGETRGHLFLVVAPGAVDAPIIGSVTGGEDNGHELYVDASGSVVANHPGGAGSLVGSDPEATDTIATDGSSAYIIEYVIEPATDSDVDGHRQIYVNGELWGDADNANQAAGSVYYSIGGTNADANAFSGSIGAVYLYADVLSEKNRQELGTYLSSKFGISSAYAELPPEDATPGATELAVALRAIPDHISNDGSADLAPGDNIIRWNNRNANFLLENNPEAGDGPVYRNNGDSDFDSNLFNGKGYLEFVSVEDSEAAETEGDMLVDSYPYMSYRGPKVTGIQPGSIFVVTAFNGVNAGDMFGSRSDYFIGTFDADDTATESRSGGAAGFFAEPRELTSDGSDVYLQMFVASPGASGAFRANWDPTFEQGPLANDMSEAYIIEYRVLDASDENPDGVRQIYVNGELWAEDLNARQHAGAQAFAIGGVLTGMNRFGGALAEMLIYEGNITDDQRNEIGALLADSYALSSAYTAPAPKDPTPGAPELAVALQAIPDQLSKNGEGDLAPGDDIAAWKNRNANFTLDNNPEPGNGPTYRADGDPEFNADLFNGYGYLTFESVDDPETAEEEGDMLVDTTAYMSHRGMEEFGIQPGSVFLVAAFDGVDKNDMFGSRTERVFNSANGFFGEPRELTTDGSNVYLQMFVASPGGSGAFRANWDPAFQQGPLANDMSEAYIIEFRVIDASEEYPLGVRQIYINGELWGEDTEEAFQRQGATTFGLGGTLNGPNRFGGAIAEVMIYEGNMTDENRHDIGSILADKYAIESEYITPEPSTDVIKVVDLLMGDSDVIEASGSAVTPGSDVYAWTSGDANFSLAHNPDPGNGPTYRADGDPEFNADLFNGYGYLTFESVDDPETPEEEGDMLVDDVAYMSHRGMDEFGIQPGSVFLVAAFDGVDKNDMFGSRTERVFNNANGFFGEPRELTTDGSNVYLQMFVASPGGSGAFRANWDPAFQQGPLANDMSEAYIIEFRVIDASEEYPLGVRQIYINGELWGEDTEEAFQRQGATTFGLGGTLNGPNRFGGAIAGLQIYEGPITDAMRNQVGAALSERFGIDSNYGTDFAGLVDANTQGDVLISPWFGAFSSPVDGWIRHTELGWLYIGFVNETSSMWMWSHTLESWIFTTEPYFGAFYEYANARWIFYFLLDGGPGYWVFDYSLGKWVRHP